MSKPVTEGVFLVGGAVRDALLGRAVADRDWVVVGKTPEQMLAAGYTQVGRDFPVFLHPDSHEEYALARTERKTGEGHLGFECHAGVDVTLEDDLLRRDLTVNALAQSIDGELIDPYGGEQDLRDGRLRHVSPAFAEDPLRILRVARFAAQLGFTVADDTMALMRDMARAGALAELPAERVWQETHKALGCVGVPEFVHVLTHAEALDPWFSELNALVGPWDAPGDSALQRWGSLGLVLASAELATLSERLKVPKRFARFAASLAQFGEVLRGWRAAEPADLLAALGSSGALQSDATERRADFVALLDLLTQVHGDFAADVLARLAASLSELGAQAAQRAAQEQGDEQPQGKALGAAISALRCARIAAVQTG